MGGLLLASDGHLFTKLAMMLSIDLAAFCGIWNTILNLMINSDN